MSFKFGFSSDNVKDCTVLDKTNSTPINDLEWFPAKEVFPTECEDKIVESKQSSTLNIKNVNVQYLLYSELDNSSILTSDDMGYEQLDLIPAKYEGGLKIWECTFDLATYIIERAVDFKQKTVLDLGCGAGVLGLVALRMGADVVHFQDYNESVLEQATIPNLFLNFSDKNHCKFFSGDWASFCEVGDLQYDIILTCETIYNDRNHQKLHDTLKKKLKIDGIILLAAKTYYFGVGGGTRQFEAMVEKEKMFSYQVCWKCSTGVQREILELKFKDK